MLSLKLGLLFSVYLAISRKRCGDNKIFLPSFKQFVKSKLTYILFNLISVYDQVYYDTISR